MPAGAVVTGWSPRRGLAGTRPTCPTPPRGRRSEVCVPASGSAGTCTSDAKGKGGKAEKDPAQLFQAVGCTAEPLNDTQEEAPRQQQQPPQPPIQAPAALATAPGASSTGSQAGDLEPVVSEAEQATAGADEDKPRVALRALKFVVPLKNIASCYLLGPVVLGDCRSERLCVPWASLLLLVADVAAFSGHLFLGIRRRTYRERVSTYNFYILLVFWSIWNLCSHPLCRQHLMDLFVAPPEIHVTINVAAIAVCSSTVMAPPSMRHLIGLVTCEFLISLVLSSIEVLNFSMDSGWLAAMRLDIVMFNVAILLIGSTIILGTMTVEKDIKSLAHEMETRLGHSGSFEDDLERRKRAVLTALCDAVLTTSAGFTITGSDDGADRVFRRPMLNEVLTDYFKDQAEKERFLAAVKKQFPEDDSVGEGPKRMRVTLRDDNDESFEADVVVSDASTDKNGKVNKYMVGMHIRGEFRARALEDSSKQRAARAGVAADKRHVGTGTGPPAAQRHAGVGGSSAGDAGGGSERDREKRVDTREQPGEERNHSHMYDELSCELLAAFEGVLQPPPEAADGKCGGKPGGNEEGSAPRFRLRRATCEVFRRRSPPLGARPGERHVDLRRLSLPEPTVTGLT